MSQKIRSSDLKVGDFYTVKRKRGKGEVTIKIVAIESCGRKGDEIKFAKLGTNPASGWDGKLDKSDFLKLINMKSTL